MCYIIVKFILNHPQITPEPEKEEDIEFVIVRDEFSDDDDPPPEPTERKSVRSFRSFRSLDSKESKDTETSIDDVVSKVVLRYRHLLHDRKCNVKNI